MKSRMPILITLFCLVQNSMFSQVPFLPPDSLIASQQCDEILLEWQVPQQSTHEIIGYNVYLEDSLLLFTADTSYQTQMQGNGFVLFNVTTLYDAGESLPASVEVELVIYAPATGLTYNKDNCWFSWNPPEGNPPNSFIWDEATLRWCGYANDNSIGTGGEVEFDVAAVWAPYHLSEFAGKELYLNKIDFFPMESTASYSVRAWQGQYAESPDELIYDQPVMNISVNQWNSIDLSDSILIDIEKYLWIGYQVITTTGYPAGVDDGPAYEGFGNMMNFGGWQTLLQINPELDYNWNIIAGCKYKIDGSIIYYDLYGYYSCDTWEYWTKLNDAPISETSYFYACINPIDDWFPNDCFVQINYCNVPVNSDTVECEICWFSNSDPIEDKSVNNFFVTNVYENWNIHCNDALIKLVIYDLTGKIIYLNQYTSIDLNIDHHAFAPGIYIIEGITAKEKYVRKIYK